MKRRTLLQRSAQWASLAVPSAGWALAQEGPASRAAPAVAAIDRPADPTGPAPLPLRSFSRRGLMEMLALSPDGKRLAALVNGEAGTVLLVRDAAGGEPRALMSTDNLEFLFSWIHWVNDERIVMGLRYPSRRERQYHGSWATMETRLLAINADGSQLVNLVKPRGAAARDLQWAQLQDRVLAWLPDRKHVLLQLPANDRSTDIAVYKVNVDTAERSTYFTARDRIHSWLTDARHQVRVGLGRSEQGNTTIWVCDADGGNWRQISEYGAFASQRLWPLGFGLDPDQLYVQAVHEGLSAVFTMDLGKPDSPLTLKLADPRHSLDGDLLHDERGEAVGIRKTVLGETASFYWDPRYKARQKDIDAALPRRFNRLYGGARNGQDFIVTSEEAGRPAAFFLANLGPSPRLTQLADTYPELQGKRLGAKHHFTYKARDGMSLHAFGIAPPGIGKPSGLPLVVFPHGGPQASDGQEFHSWAMFMADRGCLVVQPNFRGSTGYGQAYLEAGLRRWGLAMQEDLEDVVQHCIGQGWCDPARVAIVGASYGGYAALMGVVKTPALYRGAFAFAPVTDLIDLCSERGKGSAREIVRRQIGDARDDAEQLRATSPCFHAGRIQVPVVLCHGTHDRQADYRHSVKMAEALKAAGKEHSFHTFDRGDHQLSHQAYRDQLFGHLEAFLARVLAPRA